MTACPIPQERSGDGCCFDWCAVTEDDVRCFVRSLLPPGEAWRQDPNGRLVTDFADVIAAELYRVVRSICVFLRESNPCTAFDTLDDWMALFGLPPNECGLVESCGDPDVIDGLKGRLVCLFERLQFGAVPDCCLFRDIGAVFGVDVCCVPAGLINSDLFSPGCSDCFASPGSYPFYSFPDSIINQPSGCPDGVGRNCCDDDPKRWFEANCGTTCDNLCDEPPLPAHIKDASPLPSVVFFELRPPAGSDILFEANCGQAGQRICFNPLVEATRCMIEFALPAGVIGCFRRV